MAKPLDDQFDREEFYRGADPDAEDGDEYDLLPPDESIMEAERQRAQEMVDFAQKQVDLAILDREAQGLEGHHLEDYAQLLRMRFQTKHLLIAMAVLAVALTIGLVTGFGVVLVVGTFALLAGAYAYLTWKELQRQNEWDAKRAEIYRKHDQRDPTGPGS